VFEKWATEGRNPATLKIDRLSTLEMLKQMNHEDIIRNVTLTEAKNLAEQML
jgi:N-acetylmuramic acid 6-phosphate (MurNAc-6-P) etherase